jgi:ADP-ribosylglycohydrolase
MLPTIALLRKRIQAVITDKDRQGHVVAGLSDRLNGLPDSYDALWAFARGLADLPLRADWPYREPNDLEAIWAECDPKRATKPIAVLSPDQAAARIETGFLASVCGCILGKPLEVNPTLYEIRKAAEATGEWPLRDYISLNMLDAMPRKHGSWKECAREGIEYVAFDDDINYTVMGMLLLEQFGPAFTKKDIWDSWMNWLPMYACWGPERTLLLKGGIQTQDSREAGDFEEWVTVLNPGDEYCGAMIRADAYGYACAGNPAMAAELAYRDASWSHRRTGIYGTMFAAAAIAAAPVAEDWEAIFRTALQYVPQKSRFHELAADQLEIVREASDWLDAYDKIHTRYAQYSHCSIYQEVGTMMNTLRFAADAGDGICKQVSQGNDTDSYGCTCGSILGMFFGPGHLEQRWLTPFHDEIHIGMTGCCERSLSNLARRMGELPRRVSVS